MIPRNVTILRERNNVTAIASKGYVFEDNVLEVFGEDYSAILSNDKTKVHFTIFNKMINLDQISDALWDYQMYCMK